MIIYRKVNKDNTVAIKPTCDKCGQELLDYGGILLSPPDSFGKVQKYHLCVTCYEEFAVQLN
ncbi:MAG: hypothetical protein QG628_447 [Patescibacteria group bacterium]|nr:hypothetical protein [Patescibacteria group bacterium]